MGWKYKVGATKECKVENGLIIAESYGTLLQFSTTLKWNTDWQKNYFRSPHVVFVLVNTEEQKIAVGTLDGAVILYTYDGYLAGIARWDVPSEDMLVSVGYCNAGGMYEVFVHALDPYCLHYSDRTMCMEEPVPDSIIFGDRDNSGELSWSLATVLSKGQSISVQSETMSISGVTGTWISDPERVPRLDLGG